MGLNVVLISRYGMLGAAWATLGAFLVRFALVYSFSQRAYPIPYAWSRIVEVMGIAAVAYFLKYLLPDLSIVSSVGIDAALAMGAGALVVGFVMSKDERASVAEIIRGRLAMVLARG